MQSGKSPSRNWRLIFEPESPKPVEPLMGWTSAKDTLPQVVLDFPSRELAAAYADRQGLAYDVFEPAEIVHPLKAYADNFRFDRKIPWSH